MMTVPVSHTSPRFQTSSLKVKRGGGLLIKKGATLRSLKPGDLTPSPSTTYYLTDHLNSVTLGTDQTGNITSSFDYYPYGSLHASTGNTTGRRYIGQFQDPTSLDYLNARYYDSGRGQFISEDPEFWELPSDILLDPQQIQSYSYARGNPISLKDADGRRVEIYAKAIEANSLGTHVFLRLIPDAPSDFGLQAGANWTVGGYTSGNGVLIKAIDDGGDRSVVDKGYSMPATKQGALKAKVDVQRPANQTDTQFINNIMSHYNAYEEDAAYDAFAQKGYNSNNFASGLLMSSGVKQLPWGGNAPGIDPGYGQAIPQNYIKANGRVVSTGYRTISSYAGHQGSHATYGVTQSILRVIQNTLSKISSTLKSLAR